MIPLNPWEHQNAIKVLYAKCVEGVCERYHITRIELDILLFLANNPIFDTASDIVEIRYLSKSQVSAAIKRLEKNKCLEKQYAKDNRKTAHLIIGEAAKEMIADGKAAQEQFLAILFDGIQEEEIAAMRRCNSHMLKNINRHLKEEMIECGCGN